MFSPGRIMAMVMRHLYLAPLARALGRVALLAAHRPADLGLDDALDRVFER